MTEAHDALNSLRVLDTSLLRFLAFSQASILPNPSFSFQKELNTISSKTPLFFSGPIANLSHEAKAKGLVGSDQDWAESLQSLLCLEVSKNSQIDANVRIVSIGIILHVCFLFINSM